MRIGWIGLACLAVAMVGCSDAAEADGAGGDGEADVQTDGLGFDGILELDATVSADPGPEEDDWIAPLDTTDDPLGNEIAEPEPSCGNSVVEGDEACDEGAVEAVECLYGEVECLVCSPGCEMVGGSPSYCGDGIVDEAHAEQCDDGNNETESCPGDSFEPCTVCQAGCIEGPGEVQEWVELALDSAIVVELVWTTPSDPFEFDQGPEAGSDLDLHLLHPAAIGQDVDGDGKLDGWFDQPFDCFWFNAAPNWGLLNPLVEDDPVLLLDDADGAGPEVVALGDPEEGLAYGVGVHYWSDHGYGPSYATVRIFLDGTLVFEMSDVMLEQYDFWEVATIEASQGVVTATTDTDGGLKIMENYQHPYFFE
jgi:cysteine-rich repeat protein